jgi:tRNA 2-thiouridine synthesizing protein A
MEDGQVLYIRASDPTTEHDLKNFCHFLNHDLLRIEHSPNLLEFWIRKGVK